MREPEGGRLSRVFIGRHEEREQIKTRLLQSDGKVLLLYGQPLVGKASLSLQVAEELRCEQAERGDSPLTVYTVECKDALDWPDVMCAMCRALSLDETFANENLIAGAILKQLKNSGGGMLLLLLLRCHGLNPSGTEVQRMSCCLQALACSGVMTVVTSRRQLRLQSVQRIKSLTSDDSLQLLRHHAPDVTACDFEPLLQCYCYGLPSLVLKMAELVTGDSDLAFNAAELTQALREDNDLLMKGLGDEARTFFSELSPEVKGHVNNLAQLLDAGSFSRDTLLAVVGVDGKAVKTVLRRLHDEALLLVDSVSQRMRINPLVLHHIRQLGHVTADDQARLRVVTFLGRVLTRAERDLYVAGQDTVYGHLHGDWPALRHVLRQALHCTNNTYTAYLQVAFRAEKLLAKCFPREALTFYKNMAAASVRFGTARDQAVLQGLIGMAVTQGQGTGWEDALGHFHLALPVLQEEQRSVAYLRLLCDMGATYFRLNRLQEADKYLKQAVVTSQDTYVEDDRELIFHLLRARCFLALPTIFTGHLTEGLELLFETLELCEQHAPNHPDKPILINSLGLVYERSGWDQDRALQYYRQSLVERRRYASVAPGDLVPALNNVGMQYSRRGHYDTALQFLEEAAEIRARDTRWHYHTALTEQHIGQVCIQKGDFRRAQRHLSEASCIYARCTPYHDVRGKVALTLAHLYVTENLRDVTQTKRHLTEVCELAKDAVKDLSDSGLVVLSSAVQHRVLLEGCARSPDVASLLRWNHELLAKFDGDRSPQLTEHESIIKDLMNINNSDVSSDDAQDDLTARILKHCQMCNYLTLTSNTRFLWRRLETEGQALRSAVSALRGSAAVQNVLKLTDQQGAATPHPHPPKTGEASLGWTVGTEGRPSHQRDHVHPQQQHLQHQRHVPCDPQHHTLDPLEAPRHHGPLQPQPRGAELPTASESPGVAVVWTSRQDHAAGPPQDCGRQDQNTRQPQQNIDPRPSAGASLTVCQEDQFQSCVRIPAVPVSPSMQGSDHYSSCSFTDSNPPSPCTSLGPEASASSLDNVGYFSRDQHESETLCQRLITPMQETARDQGSSQGSLTNPPQNLCQNPTEIGQNRPNNICRKPTEPCFCLNPSSESHVNHAERRLNSPAAVSQERLTPVGGATISPARALSSTESSWPQLAALDPVTPDALNPTQHPTPPYSAAFVQAHPDPWTQDTTNPRTRDPTHPMALNPTHRMTQDPTHLITQFPTHPMTQDPMHPMTKNATMISPTPHASSAPLTLHTSHASPAPLTLQSVVTCAQQLMAVLPASDVATSEQRQALEKLAGLSSAVPGITRESSSQSWQSLGPLSQTSSVASNDQTAKLSVYQQEEASRLGHHTTDEEHSGRGGSQPWVSMETSRPAANMEPSQPVMRLTKTSHAATTLSGPASAPSDMRGGADGHSQSRNSCQAAGLLHPYTVGITSPNLIQETVDLPWSLSLADPATVLLSSSVLAEQATYVGQGRQREPCESAEDVAGHVMVGGVPCPTPVEGAAVPARREATENDDRLDNPGHVCTSVHCTCSHNMYGFN